LTDLGGNSAKSGAIIFIGTATQVYVERAFLDLLGRPVKPGGLANWTSLLDGLTFTRPQFVAAILATQEYRTFFVQHVYDQFLRRSVGTQGLNTMLAMLANGSTPEQIDAAVLASDEYYTKEGGGTDQGFLNAIYPDLLARQINPAAVPGRLADLAA